jgi:alpha-D-ribose 1-methylphosphonate 5-triphosphate diphosphatase
VSSYSPSPRTSPLDERELKSIAIRNALVVTPDAVLEGGAVGVADGRIAEVAADGDLAREYDTAIDARGAYVMPGIVDLHNDSLEVEVNPRPETNLPIEFALANLERRLLFSGVTTEFHAVAFMDNPRTGRTTARGVEKAAFLAGYRRSGRQLIDNQVLHRLDVWSPDSLDVIFESLDRLETRYVSINDHTPGQGQYRDLSGYKERMKAWQEQRGRGLEQDSIEKRMMDRASDTETVPMVYARIDAERRQRPFTIASHDDDSPAKVEALHSLGAGITEFPVDVDAARRAKELGMWCIVGAPNIVRGGSSSGNQSASELFSLGLADIICADYHAPSMLIAAFKLADDGIAGLSAAVRTLTLNPARAVGLEDRGAISPGYTADVIVVRRRDQGLPMVERVLRGGAEVLALQLPRAVEVPA